MSKVFNFREFLKNGFLKAVGNEPDYKIILNASGWLDKGVLEENDLAEIQSRIEAKNNIVTDELVDETVEGEN